MPRTRAADPGEDPGAACKHANVADHLFAWCYAELTCKVHDCDDGFSQVAPVARFPANELGFYDMLENVWEWTCCSVFGAMASGASVGGDDSWTWGPRVLRGGDWYISPDGVHSAHCNAGNSGSQTVSIGFPMLCER